MKYKQLKKKIKFYLAISFIISLFIMLRIAIKEGSLVCGIYYKPSPCSIIQWVIQILIFAIGITIILILLMTAVKTILKYVPEIKKIGKGKIGKKETKKEQPKKEEKKEETKPKKKEEIIRI